MDRRKFLTAGITGATLSTFGGYFVHGAESKPLRVGLIGAGWYGKSDLWRLIQVAPKDTSRPHRVSWPTWP